MMSCAHMVGGYSPRWVTACSSCLGCRSPEDDARRAVRGARTPAAFAGAPGAPGDGVQRPGVPHRPAYRGGGGGQWAGRRGALHGGGDVVSVAMGLQEQAAPGQILCSDTTARLVQRTVRLEAVAPVQVSGQPTPVTPYAILSNRGRRAPGWERWGRVLSPFVGRERELATLQALLAQVEDGPGRWSGWWVSLGLANRAWSMSSAGAWEGERLTYRAGRCLSYGSTTPYLPVLDLLRHNCGIVDTDRPEDITAKIHRALQEVDMAPEEWASVLLFSSSVEETRTRAAALSPRGAGPHSGGNAMCLQGSRATAPDSRDRRPALDRCLVRGA